ncbi:ABC transporter substrate-binding protein [Agaricicola taiwanensis]|uniref:ABC transporter substrate-binding protein n=1 Tax=Agaricicola taiwanensis TaxID=591372 RepID=A0A8J2VNF0_9RHOB|nr:ABC transporter substrate-binding protein [Agaricicola taiwanensis]GGE34514.1 ABC transporter substrate-binding protein [Agaricicola taiwanensis]
MRGSLIALAAAGLIATGAQAQEELKIGVLVTLSGAGATWGNAMKGAAELAAEDVNKAGGLDVGGKKYKIRLISYDDQFKSSEAITAMNRLIAEDKVKIVMGPMGSAPAVALAPITSQAKVITITMAFTPKAMNADTPYAFRPVLPTGIFAKPQADWVVKKLGVTKIAGLFPNDETGQAIFKDNEIAYEAVGAKFVAKEVFERERTDFTPLLIRIMSTDAEAIELDGNSPQTAGLIVKQARELGWDKPIIRTGGDATADILSVAGKEAAEGVYVHQPLNLGMPETKAFVDRWKETYKTEINGFTPFFYVNMHMLFEGMKKAGTVDDTDKILEATLALKDFPSVLGPVNWTGKEQFGRNHQLSAPFYVGQIRNGQAETIATCDANTCK